MHEKLGLDFNAKGRIYKEVKIEKEIQELD